MSLAGKYAQNIENGAVVQIVKIGVDVPRQTKIFEPAGEPVPYVEIACECGDTHQITVDEFFTTFEIVEQVTLRVMTIEHDVDDAEFWDAMADFMTMMGVKGASDFEDEEDDFSDEMLYEVTDTTQTRVH
tara:strand:- start:11114 stop:11503 length:390 start_codon:yes stop_codon:yes gene_type:complete